MPVLLATSARLWPVALRGRPSAIHVRSSDLALPAEAWIVEAAAEFQCPMKGPDGTPTTRLDNVLRLRRRDLPEHE